MQLPSEAPALVDHDESGRRGGKAPVTSSSPSSPESPSKGNAAAVREKPVKVLPCPRCESMNTKFCYYNNYSVTQPRHFCRQCQRYWTAGGTLRNVPVGGGSRKKNRHPRALNEPYLQRGSPPSTFGTTQQLMQPGGHFQQMLTQDNMAGFAPQFSGFGFQHPYGTMDPAAVESMQQHGVMYGTASHMQHHVPPYFFPPQEATCPSPFPNDGTVKSEFWQPAQMVAPPPNNKRFESSMLLNLGLNNRPQNNKPLWDQSSTDVKPTVEGAPVISTKNASPPHGSSTIEEEGSTPTNGYSTSGYEEGDAVSSMWHNLHDMDNIFQ